MLFRKRRDHQAVAGVEDLREVLEQLPLGRQAELEQCDASAWSLPAVRSMNTNGTTNTMPTTARPTTPIHDVARTAGASHSSISRRVKNRIIGIDDAA